MTDKKSIIILGVSLVLALLISAGIVRYRSADSRSIRPEIYHTTDGWGYDIIVHEKVVIHQPVIPAFNGSRGFDNRAQAIHAAELMMGRMKDNDFPRLTQHEVDSIKATYHD